MTFLITLLAMSGASADTWGPIDGGFISPERSDAPTDGALLYEANYAPEAWIVDGPGAPLQLDTTTLTGVGATPVAVVWPPAGGWDAEVDYALEVLGYAAATGDPITEFAFSTGTDLAADASAPVVGTPAVGTWSDEGNYPWGCCERTRTVTVDVEVPGADDWAYVMAVGQFELSTPSQITEEEVHTRLDVAMGPGSHTLSVLQWEEDGIAQPPCFDVVAVSAAGVSGPAETVCARSDSSSSSSPPPPCGCSSAAAAPSGVLVGLLLVLGRRRRTR